MPCRLSPPKGREADEAGCEFEESQVDIHPPFVANGEALEMLKPGEGPLHHPAVLAQLLHRLDSSSGDPGKHSPDSAGNATTPEVVCLVGMQLGEPAPRSSSAMADARHGIDQLLEGDRVVLVRGPDQHSHRDAVGIGDQVVFGSVLSAIRWIRADPLAPLFALMLEASRAPRSQSILPASFSSSSKVRWSSSQTPRSCHSCKRRQQVMPLPHPISLGKSAHLMPVFRTNRIPRNALWLGTRGRPPFGFGVGAGRSGAMRSQSSEGRISRAIQVHYASFPCCTRVLLPLLNAFSLLQHNWPNDHLGVRTLERSGRTSAIHSTRSRRLEISPSRAWTTGSASPA